MPDFASMTLEQLMTRMGIGIDQVMDMAYNRINVQGAKILSDPELMQAADAYFEKTDKL